MAIVETLEVRFLAKLGNLGAQISAVTGLLTGLGSASGAAMGAVAGGALLLGSAMDRVGLSSAQATKKQARLRSGLKKTARALKGVSAAAADAAEGIGLHRLDEINLVGEKKKGGSGGGSSGGSGGGSGRELEGLKRLKEIMGELPGFFERIYTGLRKGMKGVDGWLDKATGGLAGELVKLLGSAGGRAAKSLVDKLLSGLNGSRSDLASRGRSLLQGVAEAMRSGAASSSAPTQAGSTLSARLRSGILSGKTAAKNAADSVTQAARFGGGSANTEAKSAGANLSKGFAQGMLSCLERVKSAAASLATAALNRLKSLLKISSPSKVAYELGGWFGEGFADGICATASLAGAGAGALAGSAVNALNGSVPELSGNGLGGMVRAAVDEALGSASIVIPLNVDGMKLGEASIRGINRVTRSTGRLMLEI